MSVIKYKVTRHGKRAEVKVFAGSDEDHLQAAGLLILDADEWQGIYVASNVYNDLGIENKTKFIIEEREQHE